MSKLDLLLGGTYGQRRFQPIYQRLHKLALAGLNYGEGNPALNGEHALLDRLAPTWRTAPVILDVGAFHGDWSLAVLDRAPDATIFAFEPIPASYDRLVDSVGDRVTASPVALGAWDDQAEMYAPESQGEMASLHRRDLASVGMIADRIATVTTLDGFCETNGISHINLLKLDVEGHELDVLRGAQRILPHVDAIQLEFGGANIDSGTFLRQLTAALPNGFTVSRILRDGLTPLTGDEREEIFTYANYVALRNGYAA